MVALVSMAAMAQMNFIRLFSLVLSMAWGAIALAQPSVESTAGNWWEQNIWLDPDRGFYWYPPDHPMVPNEDQKQPEEKISKPKSIYEMTSSKEVDKELKRLLDIAIFNPTENNVYEYQKAKAWVLGKAATFADVGRRVTWQNPDIDYNAKIPLASFGRNEMQVQRNSAERKTLADLSKDYGILFFYRSDCPYCHQQAPVLSELEKRHGIDVLAISMDGGGIQEFPDAKPDNGISRFVSQGQGITTVPAMFLVSNNKKTIVPIGTGALAMEEIVDRIYVLTQTKPGDGF